MSNDNPITALEDRIKRIMSSSIAKNNGGLLNESVLNQNSNNANDDQRVGSNIFFDSYTPVFDIKAGPKQSSPIALEDRYPTLLGVAGGDSRVDAQNSVKSLSPQTSRKMPTEPFHYGNVSMKQIPPRKHETPKLSNGQRSITPPPEKNKEPFSIHQASNIKKQSADDSFSPNYLDLSPETPTTTAKLNHGSNNNGLVTQNMNSIVRPVKVAIRVRPFTLAETQLNARRALSKVGEKLILVNPKAFDADPDTIAAAAVAVDNKQWAHVFQFDTCLWSFDLNTKEEKHTEQEEVHNLIGHELVENVLNGISASCFAYGHTNTGKTHSLFGKHYQSEPTTHTSSTANQSTSNLMRDLVSSHAGLIPRVFHDLIYYIRNTFTIYGSDTKIYLSFVEIYNEKIKDLLSNPPVGHSTDFDNKAAADDTLKVREHPVYGPYVENLSKAEIDSPEEALRFLAIGHSKRMTAKTLWNSFSSRSHAIVILELCPAKYENVHGAYSPPPSVNNQSKVQSTSKKASANASMTILHASLATLQTTAPTDPPPLVKVQMVDLAGSEKDLGHTGLHTTRDINPDDEHQKAEKEKKELKMIRISLSTLGYIIKALSKGANIRSLPYRDSTLTFLLRDALNGQNYTTMLATVSPSHMCFEETLSTLRYAERLCLVRPSPSLSSQLGSSANLNGPSCNQFKQYRRSLLEEFTKIHQDLGWDKPGTNAARQLLHQTVADPQQRIAKMTKLVYNTDRFYYALLDTPDATISDQNQKKIGQTSNTLPKPSYLSHQPLERGLFPYSKTEYVDPITASRRSLADLSNADLDLLKNSYRELQGQLIELQIDLDSVRTDRDSCMVELQTVRDGLTRSEKARNEKQSSGQQINKALKAAEKEVSELSNVLKRKDETIEKLTNDLGDEKQARINAEHAYHTRTKEFLIRFEAMKKENKTLEASVEEMQDQLRYFAEEKRQLLENSDKLRSNIKSLSQTKDSLIEQLERVIDENRDLKNKVDDYVLNYRPLSEFEKLVSELKLISSERDANVSMLKQKDELLKLQSQQAEESIKLLRERQAALEKLEKNPAVKMEDYQRLQESLNELFNREGHLLHSELIDAKRLTGLIRDLRDKITRGELQQNLLDNERLKSGELEKQLNLRNQEVDYYSRREQDLMKQIEILNGELRDSRQFLSNAKPSMTSSYASQSSFQTPHGGKSRSTNIGEEYLPTGQSTTTYNNPSGQSQPHHIVTTNINVSLLEQQLISLRSENALLRDQLVIAHREVSTAKDELRVSHESMQKEFTTLWMSIQELNKLDNMKDKSIQDLVADRDRAIAEREQLADRLKLLIEDNENLQQELHDIDMDLLSAVEAASGRYHQTQSIKMSDKLMSGLSRRRQMNVHNSNKKQPFGRTLPSPNGNNGRMNTSSNHSKYTSPIRDRVQTNIQALLHPSHFELDNEDISQKHTTDEQRLEQEIDELSGFLDDNLRGSISSGHSASRLSEMHNQKRSRNGSASKDKMNSMNSKLFS